MKKMFGCVWMITGSFCAFADSSDWHMQPVQIPTRWAASVTPTNVWPEYPRPQLVRPRWQNLNGLWDYAITAADATAPSHFQGSILVPYPLESALSGVAKQLKNDQLLWYRRLVTLEPQDRQRILLHFGAVDYQATVFINGRQVGIHTGGYQAFTVDLTEAALSGNNELVVKVSDPGATGPNPRGKQRVQYTPSSGIWQTVWLETVPATYVESLKMTPDVERSRLNLQVKLSGASGNHLIEAVAMNGAHVVARSSFTEATTLRIDRPRLWSTDDPFLYDLKIRLLNNGKLVDEVTSYFGMRKIEIKQDAAGVKQIFLNDKYTYTLGVLDQGFWPDGIYTAPTDAALKFDIQAAKAMGFNTLRKHIKIEPERWYYHCDKLGMLVWQDMVQPGSATAQGRAQFETEISQNLAQLHNHPSITTWVLFNERWGAYDQERIAQWMRGLDPSRLLNAHSGPNGNIAQWMRQLDAGTLTRVFGLDFEILDYKPITEALRQGVHDSPAQWVGSDFHDTHQYPYPEIPLETGKVRVVGEFGGVGAHIDGHIWNDLAPGDSYLPVSVGQTASAYADLVDRLKRLEARGLNGSIYTQLTDVEQEQNGLMTYDRQVARIAVAELVRANKKLTSQAQNPAAAMHGFSIADTDRTPESIRYAGQLAEYQRGKREMPFLRSLTLMALRQKDQARATQIGNEFISRSPQPYSRNTWQFISATTHTSKDNGFRILREQTEQAKAMLGQNVAEKRIRAVIRREEIEPLLSAHEKEGSATPDWIAVEKRVGAKYGPLGVEAVYGVAMMYYMRSADWTNYGSYYARYFGTAATRSEYPITNLSYAVFQHVQDGAAIAAAVAAFDASMDMNETLNPVDIDTYAGLLYKIGKRREAIQWQEKAVRLSDGQDKELTSALEKMKAGAPIWPAN